MKKLNYLIILPAVAVILSGCITTNPRVTADDTAKYQSPRAFMVDRLGGIFGITKPTILDNGTIVYNAAFTSMNTRFLRKPGEDAVGYCQTKQGQWKQVRPIPFQNQAMGSSLSRNLAAIENSGQSQEVIQLAKQRAIQRSQNMFRQSGIAEAKNLIDEAVDNGFFGEYTCHSPEGDWQITIKPVDLKLSDPRNQTSSHSLSIHVSVKE